MVGTLDSLAPEEEFVGASSTPEEVGVKRLVQFLIFGSVISFVLLVAVGASGSGAKSAAAIPDFTVAQVSAPSGRTGLRTTATFRRGGTARCHRSMPRTAAR